MLFGHLQKGRRMRDYRRISRRVAALPVAVGDCVHFEHLGLGDHIVCNAITRDLCRRHPLVWMPVKKHNVAAVEFMFRDVTNLGVVPVCEATDARWIARALKLRGCRYSGLGAYGEPPFDSSCFDREFNRQYGLSFEERWNGFHLMRDTRREVQPPSQSYAFVHDDPTRGYVIDRRHVRAGLSVITNRTFDVPIVFDLGRLIECADEVHCINSSLMHWIEQLNPVGKLFWHHYARPDSTLMTLRQPWIRMDGPTPDR